MAFVDCGTAEVRVRDVRQGASRPIVFAADGPAVIEHYDALLEALPPDRRALVIDLPGFGGSQARRGFRFTRAEFVEVVIRILNARQVREATLVFPCAWGFTGVDVAARAPGLVARLVLSQTPSWTDMMAWCDRMDAKGLLRTPLVGQAMVAMNKAKIAHGWFDYAFGNRERADKLGATSDDVIARGGAFCLASLMQGLSRGPVPQKLTKAIPTTAVWGALDRSHRKSAPGGVLELSPGTLVTFAGAGHSPELEEPERFVREVIGGTASDVVEK
ncbi:MAG: alpha/beta hydrolase [Deltaproteobacteria bacterium]|nr:alpha/beta hydrolase [Deltaproteobacteria bacterium]